MDETAAFGIDEPAGRTDALVRAFLAALGELTEHERLTGVFFRVDRRSPDRHQSFTSASLHPGSHGRRINVATVSQTDDKQVRLHLERCRRALHEDYGSLHPADVIDSTFDDSLERMHGVGRFEDYVPALAEKLTRDRLTSMAKSEGLVVKEAPEVLFVALNDTGRGQMGAAMMRAIAEDRVTVHSAGTGGERAPLDPGVAEVMREIDIDLDESYSKPLTPEVLRTADVVVTMGRSAGVVDIPEGTRHVDWRIGDPVDAPLDEIRRIRDDIRDRVEGLYTELTGSRAVS